jgi:hypothetical protein
MASIILSESESDELAVISVITLLEVLKNKRKQKVWERQWISKRIEFGVYNNLVNELNSTDKYA